MIGVISIFAALVLVLCLVKYEWGVGLFLLYCLLVPTYGLNFGTSFVIGRNLFSMLLFGGVFLWVNGRGGIKKNVVSLIVPFFLLYIIQALLIVAHTSNMPIEAQLENFRLDIMGLFLPFVILCVSSNSKRIARFFKYILYVAIAVSSCYSIYLLTRLGQNPYIDAISPLINQLQESNQEAVLEEGIRIFGYISSVYPYVTEYGDFLIFSMVFLLYQFERDKTIMPKVLFGMVTLCVLVCGSRSVLLAYVAVIAAYLLFKRQFKVLLIASVAIGIVVVAINTFLPNYALFVKSIQDDTIIGGSSVQMRYEQLMGCFDSISENPLFGNGYGWAGWYRSTFGRHPVMLSFESIVIQLLCNNGIMGLVIMTAIVVVVMRRVKKIFPGNKLMKNSIGLLFVGYFSYAFFTGDYGMFKVMLCFYAIIVADGLADNKEYFSSIKQYAISAKAGIETTAIKTI